MAPTNDETTASSGSSAVPSPGSSKRLRALEAKAVAEAAATADAAYVPSATLMNSSDAISIVKQVDGLSDLTDYQEKESVYVGRSVPITAGGSLEIPIQVSTPGSVVEYAVENKSYDFGFSITAERDESVTLVKVSVFCLWLRLRIVSYITGGMRKQTNNHRNSETSREKQSRNLNVWYHPSSLMFLVFFGFFFPV